MLDTYIKNRGMTKTIIHSNNRNTINETNWDADYDGNVANVSLDLSKNGRNKHLDFRFTNDDLANLLTIPSVNQPIHKRLKIDFVKPESFKQVFLELDPDSSSSSSLDFDNIFNDTISNDTTFKDKAFKDTILNGENFNNSSKKELAQLDHIQDLLTHLSSPMPNEEYIMPFQNNSLESFKPVIKIVHKPYKSRKRSKRHKHHNYPSTRKSSTRKSLTRKSSRRRSSRRILG
jgi:hypothetical protein